MPRAGKPVSAEAARPQALQKRSQETHGRLLTVTAHLLERDGLEAATAPRIASEARLSPASIYRRFADKDDLLRLAFLHALGAPLDRKEVASRALPPQEGLPATAEAVVHALIRLYRQRGHLAAALHSFLRQQSDARFAAQILQLRAQALQPAIEALLQHRDHIRHPDPAVAARFAVLSAASSLEASGSRPGALWHTVLPMSEKAMAAELTRQMVGYLRRKP